MRVKTEDTEKDLQRRFTEDLNKYGITVKVLSDTKKGKPIVTDTELSNLKEELKMLGVKCVDLETDDCV